MKEGVGYFMAGTKAAGRTLEQGDKLPAGAYLTLRLCSTLGKGSSLELGSPLTANTSVSKTRVTHRSVAGIVRTSSPPELPSIFA